LRLCAGKKISPLLPRAGGEGLRIACHPDGDFREKLRGGKGRSRRGACNLNLLGSIKIRKTGKREAIVQTQVKKRNWTWKIRKTPRKSKSSENYLPTFNRQHERGAIAREGCGKGYKKKPIQEKETRARHKKRGAQGTHREKGHDGERYVTPGRQSHRGKIKVPESCCNGFFGVGGVGKEATDREGEGQSPWFRHGKKTADLKIVEKAGPTVRKRRGGKNLSSREKGIIMDLIEYWEIIQ